MPTLNRSILLFSALLLVTVFVYWPGLSGGFLYDDYVSFAELFAFGENAETSQLLHFILSGTTGPTGRPAALSTFVLNYITTGYDIWFFKFTNLLIHLLNGLMIYIVLKKALVWLEKDNKNNELIAFTATALWLLHPLNVSTTLYVIQRMTELSALFTLLGLLIYIKIRTATINSLKTAIPWIILLVIVIALAILSKETGILLLCYIGVLEFCILARKQPLPLALRIIVFVTALSPLLIIFYYSSSKGIYMSVSGEHNMGQRLLTEARVLWAYLGQILLPNITKMGLFHDDFVISKDLFTPLSTVFAAIGIIILLLVGLLSIRKQPVLAFGLLWFLAGHLLESTTVNLELYFEHRNYLPLLGPLVAFMYYLLSWRTTILSNTRYVLIMLILGIFGWLTYQNSQIWSDNDTLAEYWAYHHPQSTNAQLFLADRALNNGLEDIAKQQIQKVIALRPDVVSYQIKSVLIKCLLDQRVSDDTVATVLSNAQTGLISRVFIRQLKQLAEVIIRQNCQGFGKEQLLAFLEQLKMNTKLRDRKTRSFIWETEAMVHVSLQPPDPEKANVALAHAIDEYPNLRILLWYAQLAAADEHFDMAEDRLAAAEAFLEKQGWINHLDIENIAKTRDVIAEMRQ